MPSVQVRDMSRDDEYFVSTCTHINESEEIDACARTRLAWLKGMHAEGLRVKAAIVDGKHAGFIYVMPVEISPWGPIGKDLMAVPCLFVKQDLKGRGAGRALLAAAEDEARLQGKKALMVTGYYHDFWFMPAKYFEEAGFTVVGLRGSDGNPISEGSLKDTDILKGEAILGDGIEARRVREVASEFGNRVILNEHPAEDRQALLAHQTPRGIFVNGREIFWGHEAPREGIREAISNALVAGPEQA